MILFGPVTKHWWQLSSHNAVIQQFLLPKLWTQNAKVTIGGVMRRYEFVTEFSQSHEHSSRKFQLNGNKVELLCCKTEPATEYNFPYVGSIWWCLSKLWFMNLAKIKLSLGVWVTVRETYPLAGGFIAFIFGSERYFNEQKIIFQRHV